MVETACIRPRRNSILSESVGPLVWLEFGMESRATHQLDRPNCAPQRLFDMILNRNKNKRKSGAESEPAEQESLFGFDDAQESRTGSTALESRGGGKRRRVSAEQSSRTEGPTADSAASKSAAAAVKKPAKPVPEPTPEIDSWFFLGDWESSVSAVNDYLYGTVPDEDVAAAFHYEYGRQLQRLRQTHSRSELYQKMYPAWQAICDARAFPTMTWNRLSVEDQDEIRKYFQRPEYALFVQDLSENSTRQFLETLIRRARNEIGYGGYEEGEPVDALCREQECLHALMTFDLSQPKRKLVRDFAAWLERPEIADMMTRLRRRKGRIPLSRYRTYLRDLAVSLVFDRMGTFPAFDRFFRDHRRHGVPYYGQSTQNGDGGGVPEWTPLCPDLSSVIRRRKRVLRTVEALTLTPPEIFELSADPDYDHSPMDRGRGYWDEGAED